MGGFILFSVDIDNKHRQFLSSTEKSKFFCFFFFQEKEGEAARKHRTIVNNLRQFISIVEADERVTSRLIKTEDGILLITKR